MDIEKKARAYALKKWMADKDIKQGDPYFFDVVSSGVDYENGIEFATSYIRKKMKFWTKTAASNKYDMQDLLLALDDLTNKKKGS